MIDILLSTYNGEQFLSEQIESIIHQSFTDWKLIIRDDGSSDSTNAIIDSYCAVYPQKVIKINGPSSNIGVILSFELLLKQSKSDYTMFCDQDDVWLLNKIEESMLAISALEKKNTRATPLLIHTDLEVVSTTLKTLYPSLFDCANIHTELLDSNPYYLGICNSITGCTILINKAARLCSLPFPKNIIMHDAWLGVSVLLNKGIIKAIPKSLIKYRQHNQNTIGVTAYQPIRNKGLKAISGFFKTNRKIFYHHYPFLYKSIFHYCYHRTIYFIKLHLKRKK